MACPLTLYTSHKITTRRGWEKRVCSVSFMKLMRSSCYLLSIRSWILNRKSVHGWVCYYIYVCMKQTFALPPSLKPAVGRWHQRWRSTDLWHILLFNFKAIKIFSKSTSRISSFLFWIIHYMTTNPLSRALAYRIDYLQFDNFCKY